MTFEQVPSRLRRILTRDSLTASATALGLLSLFGYGITYAYAYGFYRSMGVTPREIGYTQQDALADAVALIWVVGAFLVMFAISASVAAASILVPVSLLLPPRVVKIVRRVLLIVLALAAAAVLVVTPLFVLVAGAQASSDVVDGDAPGILDPRNFTAPGVHVVYAFATWSTPGPPGPVINAQEGPVIFFGSANGVAVMYDQCEELILRLPTGNLLLRQTPQPSVGLLERMCSAPAQGGQ